MAYGISANVGAAAWNRDVFQALESWRDLILSDDAMVVRCLHAPPIPDQRAGVSIYYLAVRATSKVERFAIQGKHKPLPSAIDEGVRDANGEWMLKPTSVRKTSVKRKASASSSKSPSKDNMKIKVEEGLESNDGRMDRDNSDDMSIEQLERLAMRAEEDSVIERQSYDDELNLEGSRTRRRSSRNNGGKSTSRSQSPGNQTIISINSSSSHSEDPHQDVNFQDLPRHSSRRPRPMEQLNQVPNPLRQVDFESPAPPRSESSFGSTQVGKNFPDDTSVVSTSTETSNLTATPRRSARNRQSLLSSSHLNNEVANGLENLDVYSTISEDIIDYEESERGERNYQDSEMEIEMEVATNVDELMDTA